MLTLQLFIASCDLVAGALGVCGCASSSTSEIQFQLCAIQKIEAQQWTPQDPPRKWCRYYPIENTGVPSSIYVEASVHGGSRLCFGDEPDTIQSSLEDELRDQLQARSGKPVASWEPGGEIEIDEPAIFSVEFETRNVSGNLLGRNATIRFVPVSHRWVFSDGERLIGPRVEKIFLEAESNSAQAFVRVRVDYQYSGSAWVMGALESELASNRLDLKVIERPRRTLLVG